MLQKFSAFPGVPGPVVVIVMDGYGLPEWIRITVGTPAQNRAVLKALKEIL